METRFRSTRVIVFTLVMLFVGFFLTGCSNDNEQFIQGKWGRGDVHFWSEWNFDRGLYTFYSDFDQNRSDISQTGRYAIIDSGDDYLLLELYDQQGGIQSIEDRVELRIDIDRENDAIAVRRQEFFRVATSSLEALTTARAP